MALFSLLYLKENHDTKLNSYLVHWVSDSTGIGFYVAVMPQLVTLTHDPYTKVRVYLKMTS